MLILLFIALFASTDVAAETVRLEKSFHPATTTVSGSLLPFALAINGQAVPLDTKAVQKIRLNGKEISFLDEGAKSFYVESDEDEIKLTGTALDGSLLSIYSVILPKIRAIEIEDDKAKFRMVGRVKKFSLDGKEFAPENPIPIERDWMDRPHGVEITDEQGSSRIYNLNFSEWRSMELRSWSVGIAPNPPAGPNSGAGYGLSIWRSFEDRSVFSASVHISSHSETFSGSSYQNEARDKAYAVNLRYGRYPFLPGQGIIDFRRLIVGPFLGRVQSRTEHINTPISGGTVSTSENVDGFWIGGFFVRETLVRYRGWGLSLQGDFGFLSSRPGNVRGGPELSYTW